MSRIREKWMFRGFIAVEVESSQKLEEFSKAVKATDAPLKMVNLDIIHVTLKFLGDTDEALIPEIEKVMKDSSHLGYIHSLVYFLLQFN